MDYNIKLYWELEDQELGEVFKRCQENDLKQILPPDIREEARLFILFTRQVEVFGVVYETAEEKMLGFFFITNFEGCTARLYCQPFNDDVSESVGLGVLHWCFLHFEFKSLTLMVSALDSKALSLARHMGGRYLGEIPGALFGPEVYKTTNGKLFLFHPPENNQSFIRFDKWYHRGLPTFAE